MDKVDAFVANNPVEKTDHLVSSEELSSMATRIGISIGKGLETYLLKYGYLAYKHIELYGVNSRQNENSDFIKATIRLHKTFPNTTSYSVLEDKGDGDYILLDKDDNVYEFIPTAYEDIRPLDLKLEEYIVNRFKSEI